MDGTEKRVFRRKRVLLASLLQPIGTFLDVLRKQGLITEEMVHSVQDTAENGRMEALLSTLEDSPRTNLPKLCFTLEQYGYDWVADELHADLQWERGKMELENYILQEAKYFANTLLGEHGFIGADRTGDLSQTIAGRHQVAKEAWKRQTTRRSQKVVQDLKSLQQDIMAMLTDIDTYLASKQWVVDVKPQTVPTTPSTDTDTPNHNVSILMLKGRIMTLRQVLDNVTADHSRLTKERERCYEIIGSEPEEGPLDDTLHEALNKVAKELGRSETVVVSKRQQIGTLDNQVRDLRKELTTQVSQRNTQLEYLHRTFRQTEKTLADVKEDLRDMTNKRDIFMAQVDFLKQRCEILEKTRRLGYYYLPKGSEPRALKRNSPPGDHLRKYIYYDPDLLEVEKNVVSIKGEPLRSGMGGAKQSIMESRLQKSGGRSSDIGEVKSVSNNATGRRDLSRPGLQQKNVPITGQSPSNRAKQNNNLPTAKGSAHSYMKGTVSSEGRSPRFNESRTHANQYSSGNQSTRTLHNTETSMMGSRPTSSSPRKPLKSGEGSIHIHNYATPVNTAGFKPKLAQETLLGPVGVQDQGASYPTGGGVLHDHRDQHPVTTITVDSYNSQFNGSGSSQQAQTYHYMAHKPPGASPPYLTSGQYRPLSKTSTGGTVPIGGSVSSRGSSASESKHVTFNTQGDVPHTHRSRNGNSPKQMFESSPLRESDSNGNMKGSRNTGGVTRKDMVPVSSRSSASSGYISRTQSTTALDTSGRSSGVVSSHLDRGDTKPSQSEEGKVPIQGSGGGQQNGDGNGAFSTAAGLGDTSAASRQHSPSIEQAQLERLEQLTFHTTLPSTGGFIN